MISIKDIELRNNNLRHYRFKSDEGMDERILSHLSKVNLFVGPNNSGKSRLLRYLSSEDKLSFVPNTSLIELENIRQEFTKGIESLMTRGITEISGFRDNSKQLPSVTRLEEGQEFFKPLYELVKRAATINRSSIQISHQGGGGDFEAATRGLNNLGQKFLPELDKMTTSFGQSLSYDKYYIPSLRSLRHFGTTEAPDIFSHITQKNYFPAGKVPTIFTGLMLRNLVEDMKLGDRVQRRNLEAFEKYLSKSFFSSKDVQLLVRKDLDVLYVKIGDEEDFPILSLGDGIQMVIIMTFLLFQHKDKPKLLFVEEPELFLHPGMQRMVLEQFLISENSQFFIATHSNHLLDMTLDSHKISVFHLNKELEKADSDVSRARFLIENVSFGNRQTLDLLGTRNSSVFLSNCTIWVEGITDRRYLAHYLKLYVASIRPASPEQNQDFFDPKEDLHFSFLEYSGNNITHWSFLDVIPDPIEVDRICGRLFLITDNDAAEGKKKERFEQLKTVLKERYCCLKVLEIENLLPESVIESVIKEYEGPEAKLKPFEFEHYQNQPLGAFIDEHVVLERKRKSTYGSDSGAVTDKVTFCEKAIRFTKDFSMLSTEAQELTKSLYDFVKKNNTESA